MSEEASLTLSREATLTVSGEATLTVSREPTRTLSREVTYTVIKPALICWLTELFCNTGTILIYYTFINSKWKKRENNNLAMIFLFIFIWNKTIDSVLYMKMNNKFWNANKYYVGIWIISNKVCMYLFPSISYS